MQAPLQPRAKGPVERKVACWAPTRIFTFSSSLALPGFGGFTCCPFTCTGESRRTFRLRQTTEVSSRKATLLEQEKDEEKALLTALLANQAGQRGTKQCSESSRCKLVTLNFGSKAKECGFLLLLLLWTTSRTPCASLASLQTALWCSHCLLRRKQLKWKQLGQKWRCITGRSRLGHPVIVAVVKKETGKTIMVMRKG